MIYLLQPHTYQEVAREIAEGLSAGEVLLERDETREELASFAWFALNFVHPAKISYIASAPHPEGAASVPSQGKLTMEIAPEEFESLPQEVRNQVLHQSEELRRKGIQVDVTDPEGRPLHPGDLLTVG
jgi:hypothetical protein